MNMNPRKALKSIGWPSVGWLWVVPLLALPDCALDSEGIAGPATPFTTAVFCDIQQKGVPGRHCASPDEIDAGMRQAFAAVALNTGQTAMPPITLDYSPAALAACAATTGGPQAVAFEGEFPKGLPGCADPTTFSDADAFCKDLCNGEVPDAAFCGDKTNAHASTNVPMTGFALGCNTEGALRADFDDPRKSPDPVVWRDKTGTSDSAGSLTRSLATTPPLGNPPFDAGAASTQWFTKGDGYVEFGTSDSPNDQLSHVVGLSQIDPACAFPCADGDPGLTDIHFGISLNKDGYVYIIEGGTLVPGPDVNGSFGTYSKDERFRVSLKETLDGTATATVTYSRVNSPCIPGNPCPETFIFMHVGVATYPLRVDASFREQGATLSDVRVVLIKEKP